MRFTIEIDSNDQDATENPRGLVSMALRDIEGKVREYVAEAGIIRDGNGVLIGTWMLDVTE
jgi:hypothetical protein